MITKLYAPHTAGFLFHKQGRPKFFFFTSKMGELLLKYLTAFNHQV